MEQETFFLDITLTDSCNYRCTYCFETDYFKTQNFKNPDLLLEKIDELLEHQWFKNNFSFLQLSFWGGEPTLNFSLLEQIVKKYKKNPQIIFFLYTNGYNTERIINLVKDIKDIYINKKPKFLVQISYDGEPINSLKRKTFQGESSTEEIKKNYLLYKQSGIPITVKSTITPDMFKFLYEAFLDFITITEGEIEYFPTIDYHNEELTGEELITIQQNLEKNLIKIAQHELPRIKEGRRSLFSWFNPNRALCSAGVNMACVSTNNELFKCHGCTYENTCKNEHKITTLNHYNWIDSLAESSRYHQNFSYTEPSECQNCPATFCVRCNSALFSVSKKKYYHEKWMDFTAKKVLCSYYQINGKIVHAIRHLVTSSQQ